ncbi:MAG TPA: hypothetical protein VGO11_23975, partial [Chthoniobacteraceae bacterium]|nr:hypothetical protein [Chthoniobacteraceae bacterium]
RVAIAPRSERRSAQRVFATPKRPTGPWLQPEVAARRHVEAAPIELSFPKLAKRFGNVGAALKLCF